MIHLKSTANLSTGGTAEDVTDLIHPYNVFMAERISKIIGLDICGIDIMAHDLTKPLNESGGAVLEVNQDLVLECIFNQLADYLEMLEVT